MNRFACVLGLGIVAAVANSGPAQQQVVLKSGATLTGHVTFDGDAVIVDVEGSKQRTPLEQVTSVAPVNFAVDHQAQRLLIAALESQLLGDSPRESTRLLAEAARLAPENAQIAYWHARALVDANAGKAAERVFETHRESLEAAYPERIETLANDIRLRRMIELLPPALVARVDELNALAARRPPDADHPTAYSVFRVLDQHNEPIDRAAFRVDCNGQDEKVETFSHGYHLISYRSYGDPGAQKCRLRPTRYGFAAAELEFPASTTRVELADQLILQRYGDADLKPVRIQAVSVTGKPVPQARVELELTNVDDADPSARQTALADAEGRVQLSAFPGPYRVTVAAAGFSGAPANFELSPQDAAGVDQRVTLHPAIRATLRVEWMTRSLMPGASSAGDTRDEANMELDGSFSQRVAQGAPWLQAGQRGNQLVLTVNPFIYGRMGELPGGNGWVRLRRAESERQPAAIEAAQRRFAEIELAKLDESIEGLGPPPSNDPHTGPPGMWSLPGDLGDMFVGRFVTRHPQLGQPIEVRFKAIFDAPASSPEARAPAEAPQADKPPTP